MDYVNKQRAKYPFFYNLTNKEKKFLEIIKSIMVELSYKPIDDEELFKHLEGKKKINNMEGFKVFKDENVKKIFDSLKAKHYFEFTIESITPLTVKYFLELDNFEEENEIDIVNDVVLAVEKMDEIDAYEYISKKIDEYPNNAFFRLMKLNFDPNLKFDQACKVYYDLLDYRYSQFDFFVECWFHITRCAIKEERVDDGLKMLKKIEHKFSYNEYLALMITLLNYKKTGKYNNKNYLVVACKFDLVMNLISDLKNNEDESKITRDLYMLSNDANLELFYHYERIDPKLIEENYKVINVFGQVMSMFPEDTEMLINYLRKIEYNPFGYMEINTLKVIEAIDDFGFLGENPTKSKITDYLIGNSKTKKNLKELENFGSLAGLIRSQIKVVIDYTILRKLIVLNNDDSLELSKILDEAFIEYKSKQTNIN